MARSTWKLVRDNIPAMMLEEGKTPETRVVNENRAKNLKKKLDEEVKELKQEVTYYHNKHMPKDNKEQLIGELSDVLEVLAAITEISDIDTEELFAAAKAKRELRGGFLENIELKLQ